MIRKTMKIKLMAMYRTIKLKRLSKQITKNRKECQQSMWSQLSPNMTMSLIFLIPLY